MESGEIRQFADHSWMVQDTTVRFFLLEGSERALLIDTGKTFENVREIVEGLTKLPVIVANTHTDFDHTHCNAQFETIYMHPAEMNVYHCFMGLTQPVLPVWDGDEIDLGGRVIKVIHTPGHTSGSITFLDEKNKMLVGGDGFQDGSVYLYGKFRDLQAWGESLDRLIAMSDRFHWIFPSHASERIPSGLLKEIRTGYQKLLRGELKGVPENLFGTDIRTFDLGPCRLYCEKEKYWFE